MPILGIDTPQAQGPQSEQLSEKKRVGCGWLVAIFVALPIFIAQVSRDESVPVSEGVVEDIAGANNARVQRIRSLQVGSAYQVGHSDGLRDRLNSSANVETNMAASRSDIHALRGAMVSAFELMASNRDNNGLSLEVLQQYANGYLAAWDGVQTQGR